MSEKNRIQLMDEAESSYLKSINKIMLWGMLAHIPVMAIVSTFFNTGLILAIIMASLIASLPVFLTIFSQNHRLTATAENIKNLIRLVFIKSSKPIILTELFGSLLLLSLVII